MNAKCKEAADTGTHGTLLTVVIHELKGWSNQHLLVYLTKKLSKSLNIYIEH